MPRCNPHCRFAMTPDPEQYTSEIRRQSECMQETPGFEVWNTRENLHFAKFEVGEHVRTPTHVVHGLGRFGRVRSNI